jgi:hypothetical protein
MRTILLSDEFLARPPRDKVKRPTVLIASTIRALRLEIGDDIEFYRDSVGLLGELPYYAGDPRGYSEDSAQWLTPGSLLSRLEFVRVAAERAQDAGIDLGVTGLESPDTLLEYARRRLSLPQFSAGSLQSISDYIGWLELFGPDLRAVETVAIELSSPEFQYH